MTAILAQLPHCDPQDSATPMRVASRAGCKKTAHAAVTQTKIGAAAPLRTESSDAQKKLHT